MHYNFSNKPTFSYASHIAFYIYIIVKHINFPFLFTRQNFIRKTRYILNCSINKIVPQSIAFTLFSSSFFWHQGYCWNLARALLLVAIFFFFLFDRSRNWGSGESERKKEEIPKALLHQSCSPPPPYGDYRFEPGSLQLVICLLDCNAPLPDPLSPDIYKIHCLLSVMRSLRKGRQVSQSPRLKKSVP